MRLLFSAVIILFFNSIAFAQSSHKIDSNFVSIKVKSINNPDSSKVSCTLEYNDTNGIKWMEFRYGTQEGEGDLLSMDIILEESNGISFFKDYYGGTVFPINKNTVIIDGLIANGKINGNTYLEITLRDDNHVELDRIKKIF